MKHITPFELFESITKKLPNYVKPEFEIKEFFRVFNDDPSKLPSNIDRSIFDPKAREIPEPKEFEKHVDPPYDDNISTEELKRIADKKYLPFIDFSQELFNKGKMITLDLSTIKQNPDIFKRGDFIGFIEDPELLDKMEDTYNRSVEQGIDLNKIGEIKKFPDIALAQAWGSYYKDSFDIFNKKIDKGDPIPVSQFIKMDGIYYIVGGNRRMSYYIKNGINPKIWLMEL